MKDKDSPLSVNAGDDEEGFVNAPEVSPEPPSTAPSVQGKAAGPTFMRGPDGRMVDSHQSA